jgi:hypothetical protein
MLTFLMTDILIGFESILGLLHYVDVCDIADVSNLHAAIF